MYRKFSCRFRKLQVHLKGCHYIIQFCQCKEKEGSRNWRARSCFHISSSASDSPNDVGEVGAGAHSYKGHTTSSVPRFRRMPGLGEATYVRRISGVLYTGLFTRLDIILILMAFCRLVFLRSGYVPFSATLPMNYMLRSVPQRFQLSLFTNIT